MPLRLTSHNVVQGSGERHGVAQLRLHTISVLGVHINLVCAEQARTETQVRRWRKEVLWCRQESAADLLRQGDAWHSRRPHDSLLPAETTRMMPACCSSRISS